MNRRKITNNKLILTIFKITLIAVVFLIIIFQLKEKLYINSQPPSPEWAKEVKVSSGNITTGVKLIKYKGNYILAHNDGGSIELLNMDKFGNVLKKQRISVGFTEIYNTAIIEDGTYLYLFVAPLNWGSNLISLKLDKDFHVLDKKEYLGQHQVTQVDDNTCIVSSFEKAEFINYKENIFKAVEEDMYPETCGIKTKKGYLFIYSTRLNGFEYMLIDNGKVTKQKNFSEIITPTAIFNVNSIAISADDKYAYLMVSVGVKGGKVQKQSCIQFALDNNVAKMYELNEFHLAEIVALKSNSGGRFIGRSSINGQITEFVMRDGKVEYESSVSRLSKLNTYEYGNEDYATFCNYEKTNKYNVYVTSKAEDFKAKYSGKTWIEKKRALSSEITGIASIGFQIFIIAFNWLIPIFLIVSIYSIAGFRYKYKTQKMFFVVFSAVAGILKSYIMYSVIFNKYIMMLPQIMSSSFMIVGICVVISAISYGYSYTKYSMEEGGLFVVRFLPGIIIDTLITLLMFVPFISNLY